MLDEAFEAARDDQPSIVAIVGDAGMGKSALLHRFLSANEGLVLLQASGDETEISLDYGIMAQLVSQLESSALGNLPVLGAGPEPTSDPFAVGAEFVQALGMVQERAVEAPVALVVDDMHWADLASARALLFAFRRLRTERVLVLLSLRPEGALALGQSWERLVSDPQRSRRVQLEGLSALDIGDLADAMGIGRLPSPATRRLEEHTGGHPLYVRALLEELTPEALGAEGGSLPAPRSLATTVVSRVGRLSRPARDLVAAVAVVGPHCTLNMAALVAGATDASASLDEALRAGLLEQIGGGVGEEVRFAHPLMRTAVYDDLSPAHRHALHLAAASVTSGATALAHRVFASQGPDEELAEELEDSAREEVTKGAASLAIDHLLWAAELSSSRPTREARLLEAAWVMMLGNDLERARATRPLIEECAPGVGKELALGWLDFLAGGQSREAEEHFRNVVERADVPVQDVAVARAAAGLAIVLMERAAASEADHWARRVLELAPDSGVDVLAQVVLAMAQATNGDTARALQTLGRLSRETPAPSPLRFGPLSIRGRLRLWLDDLPGAVEDLSAVVRWSGSGTPTFRLPGVYGNLADAEYRMGSFDDSLVHADVAVSLAGDLESVWDLSLAHATCSYVLSTRGEWELAESHLAKCRAAAERFPTTTALAYSGVAGATLARAREDHDGMLRALEPLATGPVRNVLERVGVTPWRVLRAEGFVGAGHLGEADELVSELEAAAAERNAPILRVDVCRLRGMVEAARGREDRARDAFAEGHVAAEAAPLPFSEALLELAFGRFLREVGDRRGAIAQLRAARERFCALGAHPYVGRCDRELEASGVRAVSDAGAPLALSSKERAVAHLVVSGLSNREAAAELYVSVKTVEYHLGNVYAKLGISSRRELSSALAGGSAGSDPRAPSC